MRNFRNDAFVMFLFCGVCVMISIRSEDLLPGNVIQYERFKIQCYKNKSISKSAPPLNDKTNFHVIHVSIINCVPPTTTYAKELQSLNFKTADIESMTLKFEEEAPILPRNYTLNLNITTLFLHKTRNTIKNIFQNAQDFFDPLYSLKTLEVNDGIQIPRIPETIELTELLLKDEASIDEWGNCMHLEKLNLHRIDKVPQWPEKCARLANLQMSEMAASLHQVLADMILAAPNLTSLTLSFNRLYLMPNEFLKAAQRLLHLDLSDNNLYDKAFLTFPVMKVLNSFDVSRNLVRGSFLGSVIPQVPALRQLYVNESHNFLAYCDLDKLLHQGVEYLKQSNVEELSFSGTCLHMDCFLKGHFRNLTLLDLSLTPTLQFHLLDLPTTDAEDLTIKFYKTEENHSFIDIYLSEMDYEELRKRNALQNNGKRYNHWTLLTSFLDCDCKHSWLARALRDFPNLISIPDLRCNHKNGISILEESLDNMECKRWGDKDTNYTCVFKKVWREKEIDATCKADTVPWRDNLRSLNVSGRGLTTFYAALPQSVQWVDFSNNLLSSADQATVNTMFFNGRRVWLGDNEIVCDCNNYVLLNGIQEHRDQVEDYDSLTCIGTGQLISSVSTAELCQTSLKVTLAILGAIAVLILILVLIIRRYRKDIITYLYAQGWCLSCIRRKELDDKPYDAFISYAYGDDIFVKDVLVPGLENASEKFRLCVHYRDWVVGAWIPAQIMHSVIHSKRTVIVLSKNFIASSWSALEFRYALANTSVDNLSRLLIVVLDDVLDEELNPELQGYLDYNTYLRYDDPWFWEKMRYAMPHNNKNVTDIGNRSEIVGKQGANQNQEGNQDMINMVMLMQNNSSLSSAPSIDT